MNAKELAEVGAVYDLILCPNYNNAEGISGPRLSADVLPESSRASLSTHPQEKDGTFQSLPVWKATQEGCPFETGQTL